VIANRMDLTQICQKYKARIIKVVPLEDYFLVETNRGTKELREWPRVDVLRWSFQWREQMARNGHRNVERFIRTRDAKPFVVVGKKGYTLTDHHRSVQTYLPSKEHAHYCGQLVAKMHEAQSSFQLPVAFDLMKREQHLFVQEAQRARQMYQDLKSREAFPNERDKWLLSQFPALLERMERSAEMLSAIDLPDDLLAVSHRYLGRENLGLINEKVYLRGFYRPHLSIQHRDTAEYVRQLYIEEENLDQIDAFLEGYEATKPISYKEYALLLAFTAFPREVWRGVEECLHSVDNAEEAHDRLMEKVKQQQKVDRLLQHIALRAEGGGWIYE